MCIDPTLTLGHVYTHAYLHLHLSFSYRARNMGSNKAKFSDEEKAMLAWAYIEFDASIRDIWRSRLFPGRSDTSLNNAWSSHGG